MMASIMPDFNRLDPETYSGAQEIIRTANLYSLGTLSPQLVNRTNLALMDSLFEPASHQETSSPYVRVRRIGSGTLAVAAIFSEEVGSLLPMSRIVGASLDEGEVTIECHSLSDNEVGRHFHDHCESVRVTAEMGGLVLRNHVFFRKGEQRELQAPLGELVPMDVHVFMTRRLTDLAVVGLSRHDALHAPQNQSSAHRAHRRLMFEKHLEDRTFNRTAVFFDPVLQTGVAESFDR